MGFDMLGSMSFSYPTILLMKTKLILLALCLFTPALLHAERHTPLSRQMEQMAKSFKQLGKQFADPAKRDSSLQLIHSIQKNAETAKTLVPAKAETVPSAEQPKFIEDYKKEIDGLLAQISKLSAAVEANKFEDAKKIMGGFREIKGQGHEKFSSEED